MRAASSLVGLLVVVIAGLGCGGSDKVVQTQNQQKVDEDGNVTQETTVTTTDEDGELKDVKKHETPIVDN